MLANQRSHTATKPPTKHRPSALSQSNSGGKKASKSSDVIKEEEASNSVKVSETSKKKQPKAVPSGETATTTSGKAKDRVTPATGVTATKRNTHSTLASASSDPKKNSRGLGGVASSTATALSGSTPATELPKDKLSKVNFVTPSSSIDKTDVEDLERTTASMKPPFSMHSPISQPLSLDKPPLRPLPATERDKRAVQVHQNVKNERAPYLHVGKGTPSSSTDDDDDDRTDEEAEDGSNDDDEEGDDEEDDDEDDDEEDDEDDDDENEDEDEEYGSDNDDDEGGVDSYSADLKLKEKRREREQLLSMTVKVSREGDRNVKVLFISKSTRFSRFVKDIMRRFSYNRVNDFDMYCVDAAGDHVDIDTPQDFKNLTARFWKALEEEKLALTKTEKSSQLHAGPPQQQSAPRRFSARDALHGSASLRPVTDELRGAVEYGDRSSNTILRLYVRDSYKARLRAIKRRGHLESTDRLGTHNSGGDVGLPPSLHTGSVESPLRQGNPTAQLSLSVSRNFAQTIGFREDVEVLWTKMGLLGKGSFGSVYEGITSEGTIMAVKVLEIPHNEDSEELQSIKHEINLMRSLKHKNIVAYYGCQTKDLPNGQRQLEIFLEHCHGGSLSQLRRKFERAKERFAISLVRAYTRQILEGLNYLHSMSVVHRDLKSDNVLISSLGEAKLADFGCSKRIGTAMREGGCGGGNEGFQTMVGTPLFMAPEVLNEEGGGYSKPADVWSVGCLLLELLGRTPWSMSGNTNVFQIMFQISKSTGMPSGVPKVCPRSLRSFFERCFERNQAKRASAAELLRHEWITCPDSKLEEVPDDIVSNDSQ